MAHYRMNARRDRILNSTTIRVPSTKHDVVWGQTRFMIFNSPVNSAYTTVFVMISLSLKRTVLPFEH